MTSSIVTLRRPELGHALTTLSADAFRLLLHLTHRACPRTGRVWVTPLRVADELRLPVITVEDILMTLVSASFTLLWTYGSGVGSALRCYELGSLFVRVADARDQPPDNLPVAPDP